MSRPDWVLTGLHLAWLAGLAPTMLRFSRGLGDVRRVQARRLVSGVAANAGTAFGKEHRFSSISSVEAFRGAVPIHDYEGMLPWLLRARGGERKVLTAQDVRFFERSGGTTSEATKLLPYTQAMLDELAAATNPWLGGLYARSPGLIGRPAYWSLSPAAQGERRTEGGVAIGIDDDTAYFGPVRRFVLGRSMAVPGEVTKARSMEAWRRETLVGLLGCRRLGFVSVWSPTFLTALVDTLCDAPDDVLRDKRLSHRRREVEHALAAGREGVGSRLWPGLGVVSCWADGPAAAGASEIRRLFPRAVIEAKGLLATEGVVTIPWGPGRRPTLAVGSHFFEFLPVSEAKETHEVASGVASGETVLAHELEVGRSYSPVLTTAAGLYRYHLKDVVRCEAPLEVRFVGKLENVGDLTGEKLDGVRVAAIAEAALRELAVARSGSQPVHWMMTPVPGERVAGYGLLVDLGDDREVEATRVGREVERRLCEGHAYRYSREVGQLAPLSVWRLEGLRRRWLEAATAGGQRLGDIKPLSFDPRPRWASLFRQAHRVERGECHDLRE